MSTVTEADLLAAMLYWARRHNDDLTGWARRLNDTAHNEDDLRLTDYPPQSLRAAARWLTHIAEARYGHTVDPDWTRAHVGGIARRLRGLAAAMEIEEAS